MEITSQLVKQLREMTGAGMMDCKAALQEANGDVDGAIEFLRKKGLKNVSKRADRSASDGVVHSYIHSNNRVGVLIELNCETDFVARGDEFRELAKGISMHIAWANPKYLRREDVPAEVIESEKEIFKSQLAPEQLKVADRILTGRIEKFYEENCLLEQLDAKDAAAKKRIGDLINDLSAKVGEKVVLRRFTRFELGEGLSAQATEQ